MQSSFLNEQIETQKIIITGASSGIGFETAIELAIKGHKVLAIARNEEKLANLQKIVLSLNPNAQIYVLTFDIVSGNYNELQQFIKLTWGTFNILINNAGILINKPFLETTATDFANMFECNVLGHVNMTKNLFSIMDKHSHILNIGSMGGFQDSSKFEGLSAYSASKAALHNLTQCFSQELLRYQISVNCLALGSAQTEMLEQAFPGYNSPVMAFEMGQYIANFALTGHKFYNGKILPVALNTL
ncbi:MAG: SDR family oxidoreductase [Sphingobacteriales bacterium]|nr:MAG: SDR family oxidoreductase [Sphingobacteriales bacterium]